MSSKIAIKNLSSEALNLSVSFEGSSALALKSQSSISIEAGKAAELPVRFTVDASNLQTGSTELDGLLLLKDGDKEVLRLPVLAVVNKISQIAVESLVVRSTSEADAQGADVDVTLANNGVSAGDAYLFNLIGLDGKKASGGLGDVRRSNACDLAGAGYRVIKKEGKSVLQVAAKLHEPVSTWDMCEISVLIDSNGDKVADQELLGIKADHLPGVPNDVFVTMLLDAKMARDIRKKFEEEKQAGKPDLEETYVDAIMDAGQMLAFEHSTVAIIEVPVASLGVKPTGELSVQIATSYGEMSSIEPDDFLGEQAWFDLNVSDLGAAFVKMPEKITVEPGAKVAASLEKGAGSEKLFVLYPNNKTVVGGLEADRQSEITAPVYKVD